MTVSEGRGSGSFGRLARERQAWFREQSSLPRYSGGRRHRHLLASGYEDENLYPTLRGENGARRFFEIRGIKWWQDTRNGDDSNGGRPTRNMASSQIACVNFLLPLTEVPDALTAMLRAMDDDVTGFVPIEDRHTRSPVELEWIGLAHALEGPAVKTRGANSTSIDAFMIATTPGGRRAYLMEWKYVEEYSRKDLREGSSGETRRRRYERLYAESASFSGRAPFEAWLFEPFYQIMRLRLLADRMVRDREIGVSEAKVVVVVPDGNRAYRERITSPWFATAFPNRAVSDIVHETLVEPGNTYASVSQSTLADAVREHCADAVSSWSAYHRDRYGW
ncbi:MAG: hypothetical protein OXI15_06960 [Chromatiales bacterium]|nr:hypothetical protein [Chromatiales bacterium]